ncbi:hypothetical protein VPH35_118769 [Triticum aestivum]
MCIFSLFPTPLSFSSPLLGTPKFLFFFHFYLPCPFLFVQPAWKRSQQEKSWIHHDDGPVSVILYSSSQTEDVEVPKTLKPVVNYSSSSAFCRCNLYRGNSSRMFGSRLSIAGSQATNGNI